MLLPATNLIIERIIQHVKRARSFATYMDGVRLGGGKALNGRVKIYKLSPSRPITIAYELVERTGTVKEEPCSRCYLLRRSMKINPEEPLDEKVIERFHLKVMYDYMDILEDLKIFLENYKKE